MVKRAYLVMFAVGIICALFAPAAHANTITTFEFYAISDNQPGDADELCAPQLFVDVFNGDNTVKFRFRNEGPVDSVITAIYFADGSLFGFQDEEEDRYIIDATTYDGFDPLTGHEFVDFEAPARPGNLPGGAAAGFVHTSFYASVDAESPAPTWGVRDGVGEWVQINFDLLPGLQVEDVMNALYTQELQIGLHVQGLGAGGQYSESFINEPVPEPATLMLMGLGLGMLRRRYRNRRSQGSSAPKV